MAKSVKNILKEEYSRLKKVMEKIMNPGKQQPQLVLQPVKNLPHGRQAKKYLRGNLR
jgi:hypothetical protein